MEDMCTFEDWLCNAHVKILVQNIQLPYQNIHNLLFIAAIKYIVTTWQCVLSYINIALHCHNTIVVPLYLSCLCSGNMASTGFKNVIDWFSFMLISIIQDKWLQMRFSLNTLKIYEQYIQIFISWVLTV